MKIKSILIVAAAMLSATIPATAQNFNARMNSQAPKFYQRAFVGYNPQILDGKNAIDDGCVFNGVTTGWMGAVKVSPALPIYVEFGGNVSASFYTYDWVRESTDFTWVSFNAPVHCAYRFTFGNGSFGVMPYAGFNIRYNAYANAETDGDDQNLFDGPNSWNRMQIGAQIGVNCNYNHLSFGMGWTADFNELYRDCETSNFVMTVGLFF